ncbi:ABC transporter ATP-binding protein [Segetibacter aerophilus]|uniref:ABC transporter ATP-binding protein n=1 Tax=Segetibacter aerophilus TaxID=670293 RepID=A0A512BF23_9BACT|nr:ABC transporter ATP-binding protein [Segetibacter aerophilus]GEO10552.1 ABC transporter ATP-binding protein [Segetibacter aerophilus]
MIEIQDVSFGYSRKKMLYKNLTLTLETGTIYGLLGKNGAGKSTLLKNLIGLLFPAKGKINVNSFEPRRRQPSFLQTIYFIPEEVYVPSLTIKGYRNLFAPFYPSFEDEKFSQYLKELDVKDEGKLNTLSFGQQKKFIIAFALACNTKVLLLDEPTNGLDIPSKIQFRKLIASVMNEGRTIVISTHQVRDLENLIDRIIIVDNGSLLLNASLGDISEKLCFKTVSEVDDPTRVLYAEDTLKGISVVQENTEGEDSKVNLEQLFNAVTENPEMIKAIFSNTETLVK